VSFSGAPVSVSFGAIKVLLFFHSVSVCLSLYLSLSLVPSTSANVSSPPIVTASFSAPSNRACVPSGDSNRIIPDLQSNRETYATHTQMAKARKEKDITHPQKRSAHAQTHKEVLHTSCPRRTPHIVLVHALQRRPEHEVNIEREQEVDRQTHKKRTRRRTTTTTTKNRRTRTNRSTLIAPNETETGAPENDTNSPFRNSLFASCSSFNPCSLSSLFRFIPARSDTLRV